MGSLGRYTVCTYTVPEWLLRVNGKLNEDTLEVNEIEALLESAKYLTRHRLVPQLDLKLWLTTSFSHHDLLHFYSQPLDVMKCSGMEDYWYTGNCELSLRAFWSYSTMADGGKWLVAILCTVAKRGNFSSHFRASNTRNTSAAVNTPCKMKKPQNHVMIKRWWYLHFQKFLEI